MPVTKILAFDSRLSLSCSSLRVNLACSSILNNLLHLRYIKGQSAVHNKLFVLKVLRRYYPEVVITSPSIGRQGKALRRQQRRGIPEFPVNQKEITCSSLPQLPYDLKGSGSHLKSTKIEIGNKMMNCNGR